MFPKLKLPENMHATSIVEHDGQKYHVDSGWSSLSREAVIVVTKIGTNHMMSDVVGLDKLFAMHGEHKVGCFMRDRAMELVRRLHDYCHELKTYHGV